MLTVPLLVTVHTLVVVVLYVTPNPELADAPNAKSGAVRSLGVTVGNVIVCKRREINVRVTLVAAA
jgi:hypothetical protein